MMFRIIRGGGGRTYLSCSPSHISPKGGMINYERGLS